jgi:glycosyltransferase involved in cell wall biosynthesis
MPFPVASVVVPSRGGATRLPTLLDALARQEVDLPWEVIVVLDGDIDGSRAVLEANAHRLLLEVVDFAENRGRSAALNEGFARARGDVLIRCDDDLVPQPDYVARHVERHQGIAVGVVGLYRNVFPETAYSRVYGRAWDERFTDEAYASAPNQTWRYWAGNCSVTRQTWDRVGPYDPAFRAYGYEDVDWGYRLARLGVPIVLDPQLETEHRIAATTTAVRAQRAFYSGAAKRRFEAKHPVDVSDARSITMWDRSVSSLARRLTEKRIERLGAAVDALAGPLPDRVAGKAVAMLVEASARSGHAAGETSGAI